MQVVNIQPFAGKHAIEHAIFAIDWPGFDLDVSEVAEIESAAIAHLMPSEFSRRQPQNNVSVNIGGIDSIPEIVNQPNGFVLEKFTDSSSDPIRLLRLSLDSCHIVFNKYDRWEDAKSFVFKSLQILFNTEALRVRQIRGIGLQYLDSFVWTKTDAPFRVDEIFNSGSEYLPANVFVLKKAWHSHHGFFENEDNTEFLLKLNNINTSVSGTEDKVDIKILTSHKYTFAGQISCEQQHFWDLAKSAFQRMHDVNKDILKNLLIDSIQEMVGLKDFKGEKHGAN